MSAVLLILFFYATSILWVAYMPLITIVGLAITFPIQASILSVAIVILALRRHNRVRAGGLS